MSELVDSITTYVCVDCSGSTGGRFQYWSNVESIVNANKDSKFMIWDTSADYLSYSELIAWSKTAKGRGGTSPECFVPFLSENARLIVVTDGQVAPSAVVNCDMLMQDKTLSYVEVHFIDTGGNMNLSVSAPFTRKSDYCIYVNNEKLVDGSSTAKVDLSPYFGNPKLFIDDAEKLLKIIVMQNIGMANVPLRNELLDLQKNLLGVIADRKSDDTKDAFGPLREILQSGNYDSAIETIGRLTLEQGDVSLAKRIETIIQELIRPLSQSADFSFSVLQPGRLLRAPVVAGVATEELPAVQEYSKQKWSCPVQLDEDLPMLLVSAGEPVLEGLDKGYLEMLLTNPLMVLCNDSLVEKIRGRVDHAVGLNAVKQLFSSGDDVHSPQTRRVISSALSFSSETSHCKATNFALADILFGDKLVGLPELWLAVVYFAISDVNYLNTDSHLMDTFKECMINRMKMTRTNITLTGLPIEPMMKTPVDIAVWYSVVSPFVVNNTTAEDDARNRLRSFGGAAHYLLKLCDLFGYPYDRGWTLRQLSRYKAFAWMIREEFDHRQWRTLLRAQYQNCITLSDQMETIVLLDGPATDTTKPLLPVECKLELGELLALSELVQRNKTANSINIPLDFVAMTIPEPTYNYDYHLHDTYTGEHHTVISKHTFRPEVVDRKKRKHWAICNASRFGPIDRQISNYNWFIRYVFEFRAYPPSQEAFIQYLSQKQANREDGQSKDTLPSAIRFMIQCLFENYESVLGVGFADVPVTEFRALTYASMDKETRALLDGSSAIAVEE